MTALFVSDLHLDASRPAATACFLKFLAGPASFSGTLYILGDLFEAWAGDDAAGPHEVEILAALSQYTQSGNRCFFLRGNRDFLVGSDFEKTTGITFLEDETCVALSGKRALLMHGDTLCTDDRSYQRYRRLVHEPFIQALYLGLPSRWRTRLAAYARRRSQVANGGKSPAIMDVNPAAVAAVMQRHQVKILIHGHTHRPGIHSLQVDGQAAERIVLGDWYEQGSLLRWTGKGGELQALSFS